MTPMIRARDLTRSLDGQLVLNGVTLEVARGERVGVTGAPAAGRSTLLRILAALLPPSGGTLEIDGLDAVRDAQAVRTRIAYVGDRLLAGHGLLVREYFEFLRSARCPAPARVRADVAETLQRAGLAADMPLDDLSEAMRRRLALAGALFVRPDLLVLDDGLRSIEPENHAVFVRWIVEACDRGTTFLAAVDRDSEAGSLCRRFVRLQAGRLAEEPAPPAASSPAGVVEAGAV